MVESDVDSDAELRTVFTLNERLFADDELKDLTIRVADGQVQAHRVVLSAASDAFKAMLTHEMSEKTSGVITLSDVSCSAMRVFLRLLYTGHVDSSDWDVVSSKPSDDAKQESGVNVMKSVRVESKGRCLSSLAGTSDWNSGVKLGCGDGNSFDVTISIEDAVNNYVGLGILSEDADISGVYGFQNAGYGLEIPNLTLWAEDGSDGSEISDGAANSFAQGDMASVTMQFSCSTGTPRLHYSFNGGKSIEAVFDYAIPSRVRYHPAIVFAEADTKVRIEDKAITKIVPLDILLAVMMLAKRYMVDVVLSIAVQAVKGRLNDAHKSNDTGTFAKIFASAISADVGALRWLALEKSKKFSEMRAMYDEGKLQSEVQHELAGLWPIPARRGKRAKLV